MIYNWAPLVYARTYEVDYRLIAVPEDFNQDAMKWATRYILGTFEIFTTGDGPNPLRWSVFKSQYHCIVGLTCMVYQLPTDKLQDKVGRRGLQVFLGYVLQKDRRNLLPTMLLPNLETEASLLQKDNRSYIPFSELYQLVEDKWYVSSWQANTIASCRYEYQLESGNLDYQATKTWQLNANPNETWVFRTNDNEFLWTIASQEKRQISLCLGLSAKRIAQNGPFLNATTLDCDKRAGAGDVLYKPSTSHSSRSGIPESGVKQPVEGADTFTEAFIEGAARIRSVEGMIKGFFRSGKSEPEQPDIPVTGNLYQPKHDHPSRSSGRGEPKHGIPSGFRPKKPIVDNEERLPDPTAFEAPSQERAQLLPRFNEKSTTGIPPGFKLKQPGVETNEVLPDPTAEQPSEKRTGAGLPPLSKLANAKSLQNTEGVQSNPSSQNLPMNIPHQKHGQGTEDIKSNANDQQSGSESSQTPTLSQNDGDGNT